MIITSLRAFLVSSITENMTFVNFQQVNRKREYLDAFLEVLKEEYIQVKLGTFHEKRLPKVML